MMVDLDKTDITTIVSLVALELARCTETDHDGGTYRQQLIGIQTKLLSAFETRETSNAGDGELPEFREYAQRKYPAELDDDVITMVEDVIQMRRQGVR